MFQDSAIFSIILKPFTVINICYKFHHGFNKKSVQNESKEELIQVLTDINSSFANDINAKLTDLSKSSANSIQNMKKFISSYKRFKS